MCDGASKSIALGDGDDCPYFFPSGISFVVSCGLAYSYYLCTYCILLSLTNSCCYDCYDWYAIIFLRCCLQLHPNFSIKLSPTKTKVPGEKPPGAQAESMAWFGLLWLGNTTLPAVYFLGGDLKETFFFFGRGGGGWKMHHNWNTSHLESSWIKMFVSWKLVFQVILPKVFRCFVKHWWIDVGNFNILLWIYVKKRVFLK